MLCALAVCKLSCGGVRCSLFVVMCVSLFVDVCCALLCLVVWCWRCWSLSHAGVCCCLLVSGLLAVVLLLPLVNGVRWCCVSLCDVCCVSLVVVFFVCCMLSFADVGCCCVLRVVCDC